MFFKRITSDGLSHHSYLIGSGKEAAVVDPRRDWWVYTRMAMDYGMEIKHIFETHRNEDLVTGSLDLSRISGAEVYHGPGLEFGFGSVLQDGQSFSMGDLEITALHTPGHTVESMSYALAHKPSGRECAMVFTGDTLFVGEVGRVDIYGPHRVREMANKLYDSLVKKIFPLGDGAILCPAHGGGSVCGHKISPRNESTVGLERLQNNLFMMNRDSFLQYKITESLDIPPYFKVMEKFNLEGPPPLMRLPSPVPLTPSELREQVDQGALIVDTSMPAAFGGAHIKDSYSIWLQGLSGFAGWVLPYDKKIILIMENDLLLDRAVIQMVRLGYDNVYGYLKGGVEAYYNAGFHVESLPLVTVNQLKSQLSGKKNTALLDVRTKEERKQGFIEGSQWIFLGELQERLEEVPCDRPIYVICNTGHRSGLASSILLRSGFQVVNVLGGMKAWNQMKFPVEVENLD